MPGRAVSRNIDLPPASLTVHLVAALVALAVGGLGGYWIGSSRAPVREDVAPADALRQRDGSLVLERMHDPAPAPAPHQIPAGTKELRRVTATVKPARPDCPPTTVVSSLVREGDGLRAITSSPDGEVIGGSDVVVRRLDLAPPVRPWAAGMSYAPAQRQFGAWVERDFGRLRVGAEVRQPDVGDSPAVWVRAGITFGG